ncbi:hypothetical protein D1872_195480 [compost metagenome]
MKVLDIDLDFFLKKFPYHAEDRIWDESYEVWERSDVEEYLEEHCGLSKENPIRGRFFIEHDEAFWYWKELILDKKLRAPFEVVHIDSHSDLGGRHFQYICDELLSQDVDERIHIDRQYITSSNYLIPAIACRWISKLTWVCHPKAEIDTARIYLKDYRDESNAVQLKRFAKNIVKKPWSDIVEGGYKPISIEPEIPFNTIVCDDFYENQPFSYIVLAQSPHFTPPKADNLIDVIRQYILEE